MVGSEVLSLVDGFRSAGTHEVKVDGHNLASGVYFYRLTAGSFTEAKKLLLVK
jgi:hypothetical protein